LREFVGHKLLIGCIKSCLLKLSGALNESLSQSLLLLLLVMTASGDVEMPPSPNTKKSTATATHSNGAGDRIGGDVDMTLLNSSTHSLLHSNFNNSFLRDDRTADTDTEHITNVTTTANNQHQRRLTFMDGIGVTVGIIIGSGIFSSPGVALQRAGSPGAALCAWVVAGLLVLCTSMCYIELGCKYPKAGGDFEYLSQAYGERAAFSFAWYYFFISKPGSQAIIATIFGRYCQTILLGHQGAHDSNESMGESPLVTGLAAALIAIITLINCVGIKESATLQNILTVSKLCLVLSLFVIALVYSQVDELTVGSNLSPAYSFTGSNNIFAFGSALVACLWSFDGWADLNFLIEDLQNPSKTLPRVVVSGLCTVLIAYILANISYFAVLDKDTIMDSPAIAYQLGLRISDTFHAPIVPVLLAAGVALSTVGSINGSILTGGKAFYAVARDGQYSCLPAIFSRLSAKGAPYPALLAQGFWGIVLLLLPGSSFSSLLSYLGPASWFYYALTSSACVVLRYRNALCPVADEDVTFTMPWYPLPVIVVVTVACVIIVGSLVHDPLYTSLSFGFLALSVPVHVFILERLGGKRVSDSNGPDSVHNGLHKTMMAINVADSYQMNGISQTNLSPKRTLVSQQDFDDVETKDGESSL
jgi:amino acid transporter